MKTHSGCLVLVLCWSMATVPHSICMTISKALDNTPIISYLSNCVTSCLSGSSSVASRLATSPAVSACGVSVSFTTPK